MRQSELEVDRSWLVHTPNSCNDWGWAGLGGNQEPGNPSGFRLWVQKSKHLGHLSQVREPGRWVGSEITGTRTSASVDAGVSGSGLPPLCHNSRLFKALL